MTDSLNPIPDAVLSRVKWALGAIAQFNDAIRQCRAIEAHTGSAGRYEWEYRTGPRGQAAAERVHQAVERLTTFTEQARQLGIDPEAVIAVRPGEATPLPWSDATRAWRDDG